MLKLLIFSLITFNIFASQEILYSQTSLQSEKISDKIILPEVDIKILDESKIKIDDSLKPTLNLKEPNYKGIDIDELQKLKESEKIKTKFNIQREQENFSLSDFKFLYGKDNSILGEINIGKNFSNINYLLTYMRNKREAITVSNFTYNNSESSIDDLNFDFIYSFTPNFDLNIDLSYYYKEFNYFNHNFYLGDRKLNLPIKLFLKYDINTYSYLKGGIIYNFLSQKYKSSSGYNENIFWDINANLIFEANWSKDNYLKINSDFIYGIYNNYMLMQGGIILEDKFILNKFITFLIGGGISIYNYKNIFLFPDLIVVYNITTNLKLSAGINGNYNLCSINRYIKEEQNTFVNVFSDEYWKGLITLTYIPIDNLYLSANLYYKHYFEYPEYIMNNENLYYLSSKSNTGWFETELKTEWYPSENINLVFLHSFRITNNTTPLLYFPVNRINFDFLLKIPEIGLKINNNFTIRDNEYIAVNSQNPLLILWNLSIDQSINKDTFITLSLNNILNQIYFDYLNVPRGGFNYNIGIRIGL